MMKRIRALHPAIDIAFRALTRNRLQTALTMLGIAVGVATVLAMMAVGAGAQRSIEQQVRAAGLNQITVTAGNWKPKTEDSGAAVAHQGDAGDTLVLPVPELMPLPEPAGDVVPAQNRGYGPDEVVHAIGDAARPADTIALVRHPEDDPMEKHDHPLAWQRLGDLEAGLGASATLSFADAEAIRGLDGVQYVACGVHGNARVFAGGPRVVRSGGSGPEALVHAHARHGSAAARHQAHVDAYWRPLLLRARAEGRGASDGARAGRRRKAVRLECIRRRPDRDVVEAALRRSSASSRARAGSCGPPPETTSSMRCTCRTPRRIGCST